MTLLEAIGVEVHYGGKLIVGPISLTLGTGEILVLLGPSGSGKSSLLRVMSGIESPSSGQVLVDRQDIRSYEMNGHRPVLLWQSLALFPRMTAIGNVEFSLEAQGIDAKSRRRIAEKILRDIGLGHRLDALPKEMSGGEQQRVAFARTIATGAEWLFFDEPFSNLDVEWVQKLEYEMFHLKSKESRGLLVVTHDPRQAFRLGDRIAILSNGQIAQVGTPNDLMEKPVSVDVAKILGQHIIVPARLQRAGDWLTLETESGDFEWPLHRAGLNLNRNFQNCLNGYLLLAKEGGVLIDRGDLEPGEIRLEVKPLTGAPVGFHRVAVQLLNRGDCSDNAEHYFLANSKLPKDRLISSNTLFAVWRSTDTRIAFVAT